LGTSKSKDNIKGKINKPTFANSGQIWATWQRRVDMEH
jgi:hypothetical protein